MNKQSMSDLETLRRMCLHAMQRKREYHLLEEVGYWDATGNPRKDAEGERIWNFVQMQMKVLPPFTDGEIDAELYAELSKVA